MGGNKRKSGERRGWRPAAHLAIYSFLKGLGEEDRVSVCSSSWPGTLYIEQAGFKLTVICARIKGKHHRVHSFIEIFILLVFNYVHVYVSV